MNKLLIVCVLAASLSEGMAVAGNRSSWPVYVNVPSGYASGAIGSARASSDSVQNIGCLTYTSSSGSLYGWCGATNAAGQGLSCYTYVPALIQQMQAVTPDAYLSFIANADGTCSSVQAQNESRFEPKK